MSVSAQETDIHLQNYEKFIDSQSFPYNYFKAIVMINNRTREEIYSLSDIASIDTYDGSSLYGCGKFRNTFGIKTVLLPQQVDTIANYEFCGSQLSSVNIPENVTRIGKYAFYGTQLTSVTIPEKVTYIGEHALGNNGFNCLETIYIHAKEPPTTTRAAFSDNFKLKIYVPKESVEAYKNAEFWNIFKDRIYPMP